MRELSALALAKLVNIDTAYHRETSLPQLIDRSTSSALEDRHGAVAGLAELIDSLHQHVNGKKSDWLFENIEGQLADIVPNIMNLGLAKGKGGEVMRSAICRFVETMSNIGIHLTDVQVKCIYDVLRENLGHPAKDIQIMAARALAAFVQSYLQMPSSDLTVGNVITHLIEDLHPDLNFGARRGAGIAFQYLTGDVISQNQSQILKAVTRACTPEEQVAVRDIETRVNAISSLPNIVLSNLVGLDSVLVPCLNSCIAAFDDYSTDNRGDVGSWAREAAMSSISTILASIPPNYERQEIQSLIRLSVFKIIRQIVERISRVRKAAASALIACTSHGESLGLKALFEEIKGIPESDYFEGYHIQRIVKHMGTNNVLLEEVLTGLIYAIGGLDVSLREMTTEALIQFIDDIEDDALISQFCSIFIDIWSRNTRSQRMSFCFLMASDALMTGSALVERPAFVLPLLNLLKVETSGCGDVPRLCAASTVLGSILSGSSLECKSSAMPHALSLLGSKYPKVRRTSAEQLYTALLMWDEDHKSIDAEQATYLLESTAWEGPASTVRPARMKLASALGVTLQPPKTG